MGKIIQGLISVIDPLLPKPKPCSPTPPVQFNAKSKGRNTVFATLLFLEFKNKRGLILIV